MRAEIIFKDYTIDVVIHPSCATESDFTVNITTGVGPQGYTPKRGIDYWTETDKEEIVAEATPERGVDYWTAADQQAIAAEAQSAAEAAAEATATEILNDPEYKASIKGDKGDTGYTPVRGVDYWTDADKQIVSTQAEEAAEATAATMLSDPEYKASIKGDPGEPGYTPVKGVDYFDGQDGAPGKDGQDGQDGQPGRDGQDGAPGQDGVSPTITVTDITGGHRVTITDADGAHSFDVMDGEDGGGAVQDVQVNGVSVLSDGVANVPVVTGYNQTGLINLQSFQGLKIEGNGSLSIDIPADWNIQGGIAGKAVIVANKQHLSVFYGLAKAAGADMKDIASTTVGQYPEAQKSAISEMLNGSVSVFGTTPTINALPGVRYVCGEVTTLDIALPASGIVDVVFESGSTPTALTVTPPTGMTMKWANGFDPASLEANTVYEINIADGYLGVCGAWS